MSISDEDAKRVTIQSYNTNAKEYFAKVGSDTARTVAYWPGVEFFLSKLSKGEKIFEIGSGSGRDARMIEDQGYVVQRSDATEAFVQHLRAEGYEAMSYDVLGGRPAANRRLYLPMQCFYILPSHNFAKPLPLFTIVF